MVDLNFILIGIIVYLIIIFPFAFYAIICVRISAIENEIAYLFEEYKKQGHNDTRGPNFEYDEKDHCWTTKDCIRLDKSDIVDYNIPPYRMYINWKTRMGTNRCL